MNVDNLCFNRQLNPVKTSYIPNHHVMPLFKALRSCVDLSSERLKWAVVYNHRVSFPWKLLGLRAGHPKICHNGILIDQDGQVFIHLLPNSEGQLNGLIDF